MVVEIIFAEREGGQVVQETSGGWAAVPTLGVGGTEPTGQPNSGFTGGADGRHSHRSGTSNPLTPP